MYRKARRLLNWLGHEGSRFVQMLNDEEKRNAKQEEDCSKYQVTSYKIKMTVLKWHEFDMMTEIIRELAINQKHQ